MQSLTPKFLPGAVRAMMQPQAKVGVGHGDGGQTREGYGAARRT
jgi:hypothetical protein